MTEQTVAESLELMQAFEHLKNRLKHFRDKDGSLKITSVRFNTNNGETTFTLWQPLQKATKDIDNEELRQIAENLGTQIKMQIEVIEKFIQSAQDDVQEVFNNLEIIKTKENEKTN